MENSKYSAELKQQLSNITEQLNALQEKIVLSDQEPQESEQSSNKIQESFNFIGAYISLGPQQNSDTLLEMILKSAMYTVRASGAGLTLFDQKKQRLIFRAAIGDGAEGIIGYEIPLVGSQHGLAFATGEVQSATPLHTDIESEAKAIFKNVLVAPLIVNEEAIGTISAVNKQDGDHFTPYDMQAYKLFSDLAAIVIQQRLREQAMKEYIQGIDIPLPAGLDALPGRDSAAEIMSLVKDVITLTKQQENALPMIREYISLMLKGNRSSGK